MPQKRSSASVLLAVGLIAGGLLSGCNGSRVSEAATETATAPPPLAPPARALPPIDAVFAGRDPGAAIDADGRVHVAYVAADAERLMYRRLAPEPGTEPGTAVAVSPPELAVSAHGEVPPALEVLADGTLVVAYPVRLPGKWKGEILYQTSGDGGASWSAPARLHDDADNHGSHSYLASTVTGDGAVLFSWLDNRDGEQGLRVATWSAGAENEAGVSEAGVSKNETVDPLTCQCCATALLAGPRGQVWLAWRDLEPGDVRDIALARADGGAFTPLGRVSADDWQINGCPHSGPRLALAEDGAVWAVWFTGSDPGVYVAASRDDGETFTPRTAVAKPGDGVTAVAHPEIGRLGDGRLVVLYEAASAGGARVLARIADAGGRAWGEPIEVAAGGSHPRLTSAAGRDVLTFTRRGAEGTEVVVQELRDPPSGAAPPPVS